MMFANIEKVPSIKFATLCLRSSNIISIPSNFPLEFMASHLILMGLQRDLMVYLFTQCSLVLVKVAKSRA